MNPRRLLQTNVCLSSVFICVLVCSSLNYKSHFYHYDNDKAKSVLSLFLFSPFSKAVAIIWRALLTAAATITSLLYLFCLSTPSSLTRNAYMEFSLSFCSCYNNITINIRPLIVFFVQECPLAT